MVASMAGTLGGAPPLRRHAGESSSTPMPSPVRGTVASPLAGTHSRAHLATIDRMMICGAVLVLLAATEAVVDAATNSASIELDVVLVMLALGTTVPLVVLGRTGAVVAVSVASLVSLVPFHGLTAAGAVAELVAVYRFARDDARLLAASAFLPFVVVAFVDHGGGENRVLVLALGALAPASAWAA